jgi:ABC-2 type transport system permease protein
VDRLIAIVALRWRIGVRALLRSRASLAGLILALPVTLIVSLFVGFLAFAGVRALASARPEALIPLLSAAATGVGLFWALSPLLAGMAFSETHDVQRLLHFPIPLPTLVVSSLLANLAEPTVLSQVPPLCGLALGAAGFTPRLPLALAGFLIAFAFILAAAEVVGLALHALSRNRRFHDLALSLGLVLGFLLSLLPMLFFMGAGGPLAHGLGALVASDLAALSPYAWGVRAAVHAGRGELGPFAAYSLLGVAAIGAAVSASSLLMRRIYRGELAIGSASASAARRARMPLQGSLGALVEKDVRVAWRDPALKTMLVMGFVGPLVFLFFLSRTAMNVRSGGTLLLLAGFVGLSVGTNALGQERRGIALLLGFPVERWRILVAKNLAAILFRLPGLLTLGFASIALASPSVVPAVACVALVTLFVSSGLDNYFSILMPVPVPAAGRNPYGGATAGGRGLAAAALSSLLLVAALGLAAPFVFLAWLPLALANRWLWLLSLPLALAGAGATYAMLVAGAARLFTRREPELLARILGEE